VPQGTSKRRSMQARNEYGVRHDGTSVFLSTHQTCTCERFICRSSSNLALKIGIPTRKWLSHTTYIFLSRNHHANLSLDVINDRFMHTRRVGVLSRGYFPLWLLRLCAARVDSEWTRASRPFQIHHLDSSHTRFAFIHRHANSPKTTLTTWQMTLRNLCLKLRATGTSSMRQLRIVYSDFTHRTALTAPI
jgi:hypothetical protein